MSIIWFGGYHPARTNHLAAAALCRSLNNGGAENGPSGLNVLSLPKKSVKVLLEVKIWHTKASARHS